MGNALVTGVRRAASAGALGLAALVLAWPAGARQSLVESAPEAISIAQLPATGRATYALIQRGGPFPYEKDGSVFGNYERQLPTHRRGYYREYTVRTPGVRGRGARRIVCGGVPRAPEVCYYSGDHYTSFREIRP
ncbi:MAG: ribonuclease N [Comamonadaceae bacterium]|nr:ribonuclease N [Burkholderiales bacterium]MEB2347701.1 ribonuclease N [Comamonadaceae bacterium]